MSTKEDGKHYWEAVMEKHETRAVALYEAQMAEFASRIEDQKSAVAARELGNQINQRNLENFERIREINEKNAESLERIAAALESKK